MDCRRRSVWCGFFSFSFRCTKLSCLGSDGSIYVGVWEVFTLVFGFWSLGCISGRAKNAFSLSSPGLSIRSPASGSNGVFDKGSRIEKGLRYTPVQSVLMAFRRSLRSRSIRWLHAFIRQISFSELIRLICYHVYLHQKKRELRPRPCISTSRSVSLLSLKCISTSEQRCSILLHRMHPLCDLPPSYTPPQ